MPITPFIGVRISWLIVARNSAFGTRGFQRLATGNFKVRIGSENCFP